MSEVKVREGNAGAPALVMPERPIYLDYQATTPVDPLVLEEMLPYLTRDFGNPASRSHVYGWSAEQAVERARQQVADAISADPREIVWTSGATEATNLALKGSAHFYSGRGRHIVTLRTEHKATLDTCRQLEREGFEVTYVEVGENGLVSPESFAAALRPDTILASVLFVNNEIGVIQPLEEIGQLLRERKILFHVDAVQALGKIPVDVEALQADLMSLSGHKIYGPKGIGVLYVRRKPRVRVEAQIHGGGHERGMRSGTLPTHQIVGMGAASELAVRSMESDACRIRQLRDRLLHGIMGQLEEVYVNGDLECRVPHNLNLSFAFVEGESLIMALKGIAVSSGSACTSASLEPSYVLRALGKPDELAHSSIRFGIGRYTTEEEIDTTVALVVSRVAKLRELSPLWEMHLEGIDLASVQWAEH